MLWLSAKETFIKNKFNKTKNFKTISLIVNFIDFLIYDYKNGKKKTLELYALGS